VLGMVVEAVSGENYYSYIKAHILDPAGMSRSGFFDRKHLPASVAHSYDGAKDVTDAQPERGCPAGGLQASAGDLLRLVQAVNGGKLISNERMREIVSTWLATELTEDRHRRRVAKIDAIEREYAR